MGLVLQEGAAAEAATVVCQLQVLVVGEEGLVVAVMLGIAALGALVNLAGVGAAVVRALLALVSVVFLPVVTR
jgi:hypothetical protein